MRPDSVVWERAAEVREAAQGWRQVGAIDASTHDAIRNAYPDPCVTPSPIWRALTASMVTAIMLCTLAALYAAVEPGETGLSLLLFLLATAALVATERLESSPRLARRGAAGATSFWGIVFFLAGFALFLRDTMMMSEERALGAALLASTVAWGTGCWRWGNSLFAAGSAFSLFLFLARLPQGRVLWVLAGAALAGLAARRLDHGSSAPSHRHSAAVLVLAGISATYVALNVYSLDEQLLESLRGLAPARTPPPPGLFALSAVATAVVPLGVLVWAWRSRRMVLLDAGIVLLGLSLVTLRHYIHVAPVWLILTVSGAVVIVLALAVERALRDAPDRERAGFTVDPLFSDERRQQMLQTVPVVATVTPSAVTPVAAEKGFAGSGGTFGGGGAGEKF